MAKREIYKTTFKDPKTKEKYAVEIIFDIEGNLCEYFHLVVYRAGDDSLVFSESANKKWKKLTNYPKNEAILDDYIKERKEANR